MVEPDPELAHRRQLGSDGGRDLGRHGTGHYHEQAREGYAPCRSGILMAGHGVSLSLTLTSAACRRAAPSHRESEVPRTCATAKFGIELAQGAQVVHSVSGGEPLW